MTNQFYYEIIDNTLYYGANEWVGATLLEGSNYTDKNYIFYLYDLSFTSIMPKDESIVVIDIDKLYYSNYSVVPYPYLFYINNSNNYNIFDFRNITVKGIHSGFNNSSSKSITINECYFWDGWENLTVLPVWTYGKIGSVKYADGYLPDFMNSKYTFRLFYSGDDPISIGYHYVGLHDMASTSASYVNDEWIYCPNCNNITFRSPIKWATMNNHNLGRITYKGVKEIDLSNIYTQYGSYFPGGTSQYIVKTTSHVKNLKIYHLEGIVGTNVYLSDTNYPIFSDTFENIELNGLINCQSLQGTFAGMKNLLTVKLTGNNKLRKAYGLFYNCSSLTTIYTTELWNENLTGTNVFYNCTSLVGGNGTAFNSSKIDASMMHVDREGQEGYFTYNKATDYYKVYVPHEAVLINYPETLFSKGDNVSIAFIGYNKDTTLDYWLQYDPTTKRYKNIGSQNPLNFEILSDTALIPIVKKGTPSAVYNVDLSSVPSNSCTLTGAGTYTVGDDVIITASPNEGFIFKQWEELINDTWIILSYDNTYTLHAIGRDRTIRAVLVDETDPDVVEITLSITGGSGSVEGAGKYVKGTQATIKAIAGSKHLFKSWNLPESAFVVSTQNPYTFTVVKSIEYQAVMVDNPYGGGGSSSEGGGNGDFTDYIDVSPIPPLNLSATNTDLLSIYTLDINGVNELAKFIYSDIFDASLAEKLSSILKLFGDVMDQIVSFGVLPFRVPGTSSDIMPYLDIHAPVHCKVPTSQYITINCGSKKIDNYWNNFLDYSPYTKYEIYLPFIGYKDLDADEIVNKTLTIKYRVDILTGDLICYLSIDGNVRYQYGGNCLISLPLSSTTKNTGSMISGVASLTTAVGGLLTGNPTATAAGVAATASSMITEKQVIKHGSSLSSSANYLGILYPILYISRPRQNVPTQYGKFKGYPSNITTQLKNLSGFTKVDTIHLENMSATDDEIEEIEGLLKEGVIIL